MLKQGKQTLLTLSILISFTTLAWAADPSDLPGVAAPVDQLGENDPGSVLIYNLFSSDALKSEHDTAIHLTNISRGDSAYVHLFFVSETCAIADSYICLTPNQTARFLASDVDPGSTGYLLAVATNLDGCPIPFNNLLGSAYVKLPTGHQAKLPALAVAGLRRDNCRPNTAVTQLDFDGREYRRLPRMIALDQIASRLDGNDTMLIVNSLNGNLATGVTPTGTLFGILFDDVENAYSFSVASACQIRRSMSDTFPRTFPRFTQIIPQGRTGWMRLNTTEPRAITGAALNYNPNALTERASFNGGANLNSVRYNESTSIAMPVFPPSC